MAYLLITNGCGRHPHIDEVDDLELAVQRLQTDPSAVLIEGRVVPVEVSHRVVVDGRSVAPLQGELIESHQSEEPAHAQGAIPLWSADQAPRDSAQAVEGKSGRRAGDAPGAGTGVGNDDAGGGEDG